jgi:GNAT superfamily N-acetyltransferase
MSNTINGNVKKKEYLNKKEYEALKKLESICLSYDKTSLKLELDFKFESNRETVKKNSDLNEFMYYVDSELVGYIGISCFDGFNLEVNGMVHPEHRKQGIFKKLFDLVLDEKHRRSIKNMLLLCDSKSIAGQRFIKSIGAKYKLSEYEMYLQRNDDFDLSKNKLKNLIFRKATNDDAKQIAYQNSIYFGVGIDEVELVMPETEEKKGIITYLAEKDGKIIGKTNVQLINEIGGIYGVGVLPEYRSKGYGREILLKSIELLEDMNANQIMLQVEAENSNALNLYKSCGFVETASMDYFEY